MSIEDYKAYQSESNLQWMARYERLQKEGILVLLDEQIKMFLELGSIGIAQLTDAQLEQFRAGMNRIIEVGRQAIQVSEHTSRSRGLEVKSRTKERDMHYVPPVETQIAKAEQKLSKQGKSAEEIKIFADIAKMDFNID